MIHQYNDNNNNNRSEDRPKNLLCINYSEAIVYLKENGITKDGHSTSFEKIKNQILAV